MALDPTILGGLFTLAAAGIGFGAVGFQINRQGKLSRLETRETERRHFKRELYRDGVKVARSLADASQEYLSYLLKLRLEIKVATGMAQADRPFALPTCRFLEVLEKQSALGSAAAKFAYLIEQRRIIDPRIVIFRDAVSERMHTFSNDHPRNMAETIMVGLPVDNPLGGTFPYEPPGKDRIAEIDKVVDHLVTVLCDLTAYCDDFVVEMQNTLLGDVFNAKVTKRVPVDPARRAICLEDFEDLQAWLSQSKWGQELTYWQTDAQNRFQSVDDNLE